MSSFYSWFWGDGVRYILYGLLLISGLWLSKNIMISAVISKYQEFSYRYRIRKTRNQVKFKFPPSYKNPILKHIQLLLRTTARDNNYADVPIFLTITGLTCVISAVFVYFMIRDFVVAVLLGMLVSLIPYLLKRLKLNKLRYIVNEEFLTLMQRLTQNYNAAHNDMYYGLVETYKELKNPQLKRVIIKLVSDLQVSRNETELRESIQAFTYTAGTNWSKRLGSIILKAYLNNENVLNALMTLTKQIEDTTEMLEEERSEMLDVVYNGYLTLPILIGSIVLGYVATGVQDYFKLQFGYSSTQFLFILSVIGVIFSFIIARFLKHPKNDL